MSNVFYGADGRFYDISQSGLALSKAAHLDPSSATLSASAKMLSVDDMAAAAPTVSFHP